MSRRLVCLIILMGMWLSVIPADAAFLLYNTTTLRVYGGGDDPFAIHIPAEHDLFEVPGLLFSEIVWPVPTAPSSCATGRLQWTKLSAGATLPLLYNTDAKIFKCASVGSAAEVTATAHQLINEATITLKGEATTDVIAVMALGQAFCAVTTTPPGNGSTCASLRANNVTMGNHMGSLPAIVTWQDVIITIFADAAAAIKGFGF
jgi:hypothetical protein